MDADHLHAFRLIEYEIPEGDPRWIELRVDETHICHWCGIGMEAFKAEQSKATAQ